MPQILKKLRLKFMLMTTGIVAVIVIIIGAGYCINVYTSAGNEIKGALDHALNTSSGADRFEEMPPGKENPNEGNPPDNKTDGQSQPPSEDGITSENSNEDSTGQQIDIFHGRAVLVYSAVIDGEGNVIRNDSPAIGINDEVLASAISTILSADNFSMNEGSSTSGRIDSQGLFYQTRVQDGVIYLGLADTADFDKKIQESIFGALGLAGLALIITIAVSFFLARLFMRPVEDSWNRQRRFIADASHELKTPLTVIMANTEIVRSEPSSTVASQMKWLDGTMDESERMHGLIADLLLLARMDDEEIAGGITSFESVNFSEAVENTLVSFEAIAFERNLNIEEDVALDIQVKGVRSRLTRLPDILVDNACKYATVDGFIKVTLKSEDGKAILQVFNTGPAISKDDMEHLFDRFYRADESRCDDIPGYGLGLSIAQNIVEECGGKIEVENVDGKNSGVTFTVTLPQVL